jgi:hypothetical protein
MAVIYTNLFLLVSLKARKIYTDLNKRKSGGIRSFAGKE